MTTTTLSQSPSAIRSRERRAAKKAELANTFPTEGSVAVIAESIENMAAVEVKVPAKAPKKATKATPRSMPTASPVKMSAAQKRSVGQVCAAVASGFLPVASYVMAHIESATNPWLWVLVAAALMFSAPTLVDWAKKWCGNIYKAVGFTVLLEGVMVFSSTAWLSYTGLAILVAINATNAYQLAARKQAE